MTSTDAQGTLMLGVSREIDVVVCDESPCQPGRGSHSDLGGGRQRRSAGAASVVIPDIAGWVRSSSVALAIERSWLRGTCPSVNGAKIVGKLINLISRNWGTERRLHLGDLRAPFIHRQWRLPQRHARGMAYQAVGIRDLRTLACRKESRTCRKVDLECFEADGHHIGLALRLSRNRFRQVSASAEAGDRAKQHWDRPKSSYMMQP